MSCFKSLDVFALHKYNCVLWTSSLKPHPWLYGSETHYAFILYLVLFSIRFHVQNEYAVFFLLMSGHFHLTRIMFIKAVVNRNVRCLGFFCQIDTTKNIWGEGTSVKKLPQLDWPAGIPVVYFLDLCLMLESNADFGRWNF